jgi:hypothetical protein
MHLIVPDILAEARGLSIGACACAAAVGLLLWLFGWRWHRFWTVVAVTVAGGLYGLATGQTGGGSAIAIGFLLAVSAGLLALELARLLAFAAGGTAAWLAAGALFPNVEAIGIFCLAGGLAGILFYRLWVMILTSFVGTLLLGHGGMLLVETFLEFNAADWSHRNGIGLSVAVGLVTLLGLAMQGAQVRKRTDNEPRRRFWWGSRQAAADGDDLPADWRSLRDVFRRKVRN